MTLTVTAAAEETLAVKQGEPLEVGYAYKATSTGPRESLVGYRATAQIRSKQVTTSTLVLDLDAYLEIDTTDNVCWLRMTAAQTRLVTHKGFWDLFLVAVDDPGVTVKLAKGPVTVEFAVTLDD